MNYPKDSVQIMTVIDFNFCNGIFTSNNFMSFRKTIKYYKIVGYV